MRFFSIILIAAAAAYHPIYAADFTTFDDIPEFEVKNAGRAHIKLLRDGGYVLFMRHTNSDTSHPDQLNINLNDCETQRPLSAEGIHMATRIGRSIRIAKIPIGEIFSSPMCRTKDTASFTFGSNFNVDDHLMYTANIKPKEKISVLEATRELLSKPIDGKVNRVIVAHAQNIMGLIGYFPSPEGTIVIFKPLGNKQFEYVATVEPEQWKFIQQ